MADREQYQLQLRVVKGGARTVHSDTYRGTESDAWEAGYILTATEGGRAATLPPTIDSTISGPVKFVALDEYDGESTTEYQNLQSIADDTVFECQIKTGSATTDDIDKRGVLVQDATTGNYAVDLSNDTNASLQVVDVEPQFQPFGTYADGDYNLVWFKFLGDVLDIAVPEASSS